MNKILIAIICTFILASIPFIAADSKGLGYYGKADDFTLLSSQDEEVSLSSSVKPRQYTLLVFIKFSDPACRKEADLIKRFYSDNGSIVKVLAIDIMENKATVKKNIDKLGLNYPVLLDLDGAVAKAYSIRGLPTLILLDRQRQILHASHKITEVEKALESKGIR